MAVERVPFTKDMKADYTILFPMMAEVQFRLLERVFSWHGYRCELLAGTESAIVEQGLKSVHNDTCYPALLVIGQILHALKSGRYDLDRTAVIMSQTGGGCRASNYIHLLRKALKRNGLGHIPVISFNVSGLEDNPGFRFTPRMVLEMLLAVVYGDTLMHLSNQTRPYEATGGETDALVDAYVRRLASSRKAYLRLQRNLNAMAKDFDAIAREPRNAVKVGIVGEIYVKYSPLGNNNLEAFLHNEGAEVVLPLLLDFCIYACSNGVEDFRLYRTKPLRALVNLIAQRALEWLQRKIVRAVKPTRLRPPPLFKDTWAKAKEGYVAHGNKMGEGWLLTAEMIELVENGVSNIICTQPFGCLPNHIVGKGMIRRIRDNHPEANIVAIDYDPGATRVNQENRIKLMLSMARRQKESAAPAYPREDTLAAQAALERYQAQFGFQK